jgi:hypothetical protein
VNPFCHVEPGITTRFTSAGSYCHPEDRRDAVGHVPELARRAAPGELDGVERHLCNRPSAVPSLAARRTSRSTCWRRIQMRGARVNQLDLRLGKVLRFSSQRATVSVDMFNALNADTVLTYNQAFTPGGQWLVPTTVLTARTAKITVQYDF